MLQKQSAGSSLKGWLSIHVYLSGKYLNKLEKHILGSLILSNLQHYNNGSSFRNLFHLVHDEYTMRRRRVPCKVIRCAKLRGAQRSPELGSRSTDFRAPENLIFPALQFQQK